MMRYQAYFLLGLLSLFSNTALAAGYLSTYDPNTGMLAVQDYDDGDNQHYYLEFVNQGDFNFVLKYAESTSSSFQEPAYFNAMVNGITIPSVFAYQQYFSVDLVYKGGYLFQLTRADAAQPPNTPPANPPNSNQPINPSPNNSPATLATLVGAWQGSYWCGQGETNVAIDIDDAWHARFRFSGVSSKSGAFDGYIYSIVALNNNTVTLKPLPSIDNKYVIAGWHTKPSDAANWSAIGFTATVNGGSMNGQMDHASCGAIKLSKVKTVNVRPQDQLDLLNSSVDLKATQTATFAHSCAQSSILGGCNGLHAGVAELHNICDKDYFIKACHSGYQVMGIYTGLAPYSVTIY